MIFSPLISHSSLSSEIVSIYWTSQGAYFALAFGRKGKGYKIPENSQKMYNTSQYESTIWFIVCAISATSGCVRWYCRCSWKESNNWKRGEWKSCRTKSELLHVCIIPLFFHINYSILLKKTDTRFWQISFMQPGVQSSLVKHFLFWLRGTGTSRSLE